MNLCQKVVVITGGAKGLGFAIAKNLIEQAAIAIIIDNDKEQLRLAAAKLNSTGFLLDTTNETEVLEAKEEIIKKFQRIDIWINNAGIWMPKQLIENIDIEKAKKLFEVNVFGYVHGCRAAIPQMKKQKSGTIVNISSTTAFDGMNGSSGAMYVSSKYALRGFTNALREELQESPITVIGVYPGGMKTEIFNEARPESFDKFMSPDEVAQKIIENLKKDTPEIELVLKRSP